MAEGLLRSRRTSSEDHNQLPKSPLLGLFSPLLLHNPNFLGLSCGFIRYAQVSLYPSTRCYIYGHSLLFIDVPANIQLLTSFPFFRSARNFYDTVYYNLNYLPVLFDFRVVRSVLSLANMNDVNQM